MMSKAWFFILTAVLGSQVLAGPRMLASPRTMAPLRMAAAAPSTLQRPGLQYGSAPAIRYASAGQVGLGNMGMSGYGNIPVPTSALQTLQPQPQSNLMADLMKAFKPVLPSEVRPIPPAETPGYTGSPGVGHVPYRSSPQQVPFRDASRAHLQDAPRCMGESAGALTVDSKVCNAVYLGDDLAVTNCHCLRAAKLPGRGSLHNVAMRIGSSNTSVTQTCAQSLSCSTEYDYAILSCAGLKKQVTPVRIGKRYPSFTEQVFVPTHDFSANGIVKRINTGSMTEFYSSIRGHSMSTMKAYVRTIQGNSGSGVHDRNDEMVGLVWGGLSPDIRQNTTFTPMVDIMNDLRTRQPDIHARIERAQKASREGTGEERTSACQAPTVAPLAQAGRN